VPTYWDKEGEGSNLSSNGNLLNSHINDGNEDHDQEGTGLNLYDFGEGGFSPGLRFIWREWRRFDCMYENLQEPHPCLHHRGGSAAVNYAGQDPNQNIQTTLTIKEKQLENPLLIHLRINEEVENVQKLQIRVNGSPLAISMKNFGRN